MGLAPCSVVVLCGLRVLRGILVVGERWERCMGRYSIKHIIYLALYMSNLQANRSTTHIAYKKDNLHGWCQLGWRDGSVPLFRRRLCRLWSTVSAVTAQLVNCFGQDTRYPRRVGRSLLVTTTVISTWRRSLLQDSVNPIHHGH